MSNSFENRWIHRTKWLTQALIISGTLNIGLISTFVYFVLKEKQDSLAIELKPAPKDSHSPARTNEELLQAYSFLPFQELILRLENKDLIEDGLSKRDLALACLTAFHHFNLEKALGGLALQKRVLPMRSLEGQEAIEVPVFPGLADFQYQAVIQFARTEKWPFTSQGLFYELKRSALPRDLSLLEAFYLSPEFHAVYTLFSKTGLNLSKEQIVELIVEGEWKMLASFTAHQRHSLDLSPDCRRALLLTYLDAHSAHAAELLLSSDEEFIVKRLDDAQILTILDLLPPQTAGLEKLAKELLASPRIDAVRQHAAAVLYQLAAEPFPETYDHNAALARFLPAAAPKVEALPEPVKAPVKEAVTAVALKKKMHTIEPGDSLWKIARKYHVTVEAIMKANKLESERLRVGRQIEIPEKS